MVQKGDVLTVGLSVSSGAIPATGSALFEVVVCTGDLGI